MPRSLSSRLAAQRTERGLRNPLPTGCDPIGLLPIHPILHSGVVSKLILLKCSIRRTQAKIVSMAPADRQKNQITNIGDLGAACNSRGFLAERVGWDSNPRSGVTPTAV
jgi:hypothetical protein